MCISVREFLQCLRLRRAWSVELPASVQAVNTLEAVLIDNTHFLTEQRELIPQSLRFEGKMFCVPCPGFGVPCFYKGRSHTVVRKGSGDVAGTSSDKPSEISLR